MATPIASPLKGTSIIAERFKTKMCQNYEKTGVCPYEIRCMFAHGDADLRTKEMNLEEGLTTEDAIKAFQRTRKVAVRRAERRRMRRQRAAVAKAEKDGVHAGDDDASDTDSHDSNDRTATRRDSPDSHGAYIPATPATTACKKTPAAVPLELTPQATPIKLMPTPPARAYRHNPYAATVRTPPSIPAAAAEGTPVKVAGRRLSFKLDEDTLSLDNPQMLPPPMPMAVVGALTAACNGAVSPLVAAMSARRVVPVMC